MNNIDCSMSVESLELLKTTKDKTIVGYLVPNEDMEKNTLFNLVLLFTNNSSVVIRTDYTNVKLCGEDETISKLKCIEDDLAEYGAYHKFKAHNLTIDSIEIVTDLIKINNTEEAKKYSVTVDSGIVFKCAEGDFTIALNSDYSDDDWLRVSASDTILALRPLEDVKDAWGDGEDGNMVTVDRSSHLL